MLTTITPLPPKLQALKLEAACRRSLSDAERREQAERRAVYSWTALCACVRADLQAELLAFVTLERDCCFTENAAIFAVAARLPGHRPIVANYCRMPSGPWERRPQNGKPWGVLTKDDRIDWHADLGDALLAAEE